MIIDCASNTRLEGTQKIVWMLVIVFLHFIGALIYFAVGRGAHKNESNLPTFLAGAGVLGLALALLTTLFWHPPCRALRFIWWRREQGVARPLSRAAPPVSAVLRRQVPASLRGGNEPGGALLFTKRKTFFAWTHPPLAHRRFQNEDGRLRQRNRKATSRSHSSSILCTGAADTC
jgi:hypothetical protein